MRPHLKTKQNKKVEHISNPSTERLRQEDCELEGSWGGIGDFVLKI